MRKQSGFALLEGLLIFVILFLVAGTGWYIWHARQNANKTYDSSAKTATSIATKTTTKSTAVKTSNKAIRCTTEDCIQVNFASCTAATFAADQGDAGAASYEIKTKSATGCQMSFTYTKSPDPNLTNKSMTCTYDNKKGFEDAITEVFDKVANKQTTDCTGPLVAVLQSLGQ